MKENTLIHFTNKFQLSKTLRFELKPIGQTLDNIKTKGLITKDDRRAKSYKEMKKSIDEYHKYFINLALSNVRLKHLQAFADLYYETNVEKKKEDAYKKAIGSAQTNLRKEIASSFKEGDAKDIFAKLNKKELFTELLEEWRKGKNDFYFDEEFKTFTTYFSGFNQNRANMYSHDAKSTAIAYRLVHENLPKFLDNIKIFEKVKLIPQLQENIKGLYKNIEGYLNIIKIDDAFELNYFNETLTQKDIDAYNLIIGGRTAKEGKTKIQGINEFINLYNQTQDKKNKIPKLKVLYKQILSDKTNISFLPDKFEDSNEVLNAIEQYYKSNLLEYQTETMEHSQDVLTSVKALVSDIASFDISKIYMRNDTSLTQISQTLFDDWNLIKLALEYSFVQKLIIGKNGITKKQQDEKDKFLTKQTYYSIKEIENALLQYKDQNERLKELKQTDLPVANYFKNHFVTKKNGESGRNIDLIVNIQDKYRCVKGILANNYPENKDLKSNNNTDTLNLKLFLDSLMELMHFIRPLAIPADFTQGEKDDKFYEQYNNWNEQLELLIPLYNKVRNYATQKPYSDEKFKLNFENSYFLNGWATDYDSKAGLIFEKDGLYYLAINEKKLTQEEKTKITQNVINETAKRIVLDFQKPDNKNIPRLFIRSKGENFAPAVEKYNLPINDVIEIYDSGKFKTEFKKSNPEDFKKSLHKLIDYFKLGFSKHDSYKHYNFGWKETSSYEDIAQFYNDVEVSCYDVKFKSVNWNVINEFVSEGKLYLFQIYNKDFSSYSKGKPNMHTIYWKALFDTENLKDVVYKLNGQAELFYRKKSVNYDEVIMKQGHHYIELKDKFTYPIIKDKRYTEDKFLFHVPITLNFKATGNDYINVDVLNYLKNNPDINIIGLDRGERHLIYLSLVNQKGEVLKDKNDKPIQYSLNEITNIHKGEKLNPVDYQKLLDKKETERDEARKNWGEIENIKELKEGYISQVVHLITTLMVEYNAIVVMEDLNFGFKRGRFKVEKQVYQKLEKMLIDKLNYLVIKDRQPTELGGIYHALQLTNKFTSFKEMGKQNGFLFYVPAWNTSKIDPTTGFVNLFNTKYETKEKAQDFFRKFKDIRFNNKENYFEFEFDYNDFTAKATGTKTDWTVCTMGKRIINLRDPNNNNKWTSSEPFELTDKFKDFFNKNNINYNSNLKGQILSKDDASFYKDLLYWFKVILQLRNSKINSTKREDDFIISPVKNSKGRFFYSIDAEDNLPKDADANGAYHIAKKGLWILEQINNYNQDDNWKKLNLAVSNKDWLNFVQLKK